MNFLKAIASWFVKQLPYVLIGVGVTIYLCAEFSLFPGAKTNSIIKDLGRVMLGSGVFTAIVKTNLFLNLFQNELGKVDTSIKTNLTGFATQLSTIKDDIPGAISFDNKYLSKRTDLNQIWINVTRALYGQKFPNIREEFESIITHEYLPTSHDFYYNNFLYKMDIKKAGGQFITVNETCSYSITSCDAKKSIQFDNSSEIKRHHEDMTSYQVTELRINSVLQSLDGKVKTETNGDVETYKLKFELQGALDYQVSIKRKKTYSLDLNGNRKSFGLAKFCKRMEVELNYPHNMKVHFHSSGTINDFTEETDNKSASRMRMVYEGIIFPKQGFVLIFS